ncbi:MAG: SDR family NAD(P)-dependent oxidoreductase [Verrucomicrobia bacterium]|nr:SDR family NAD(P)-dependent oxidoreductase [Verrucomicrobiota bacterium]
MNIKGKAAVVTGASRGVGAATALALAKGGCSVLINYSSSKEAAEAVRGQAEAEGVMAITFQGDVADDSACREMMQAAVDAFGRIDILVNNAGTTQFIPHPDLEAVTDEVWSRIMDVNLKGPFQCARAAKPHIEASGEGEIVTVSSSSAYNGRGSCIPYGTSKAAVVNLTISLARVFGPKIRVNAVAPGIIKGDWLKQGLGDKYDQVIAEKESKAVLKNSCTPEDVADAILSLITGSDLVTGQTLLCDGGAELGI